MDRSWRVPVTQSPVMIVADDPALVKELSGLLKKNGYMISATVSGGEDALKNEANGHPEMVIIDLSIPGRLDGIATAEQVRFKRGIPVIFIVSSEEEATRIKALHPGSYGYISKPFDERELRVALELALYRQEAEQKLHVTEALHTRNLESLNLRVQRAAHDFNNILSSVLANIQLTKRELNEISSGYDRLTRAEDSLLRARELSRQLLTFSGGEIPWRETTKIHLPLKACHTPADTEPVQKTVPLTKKTEPAQKKILLMDDEEAILSATGEMLKFLGYEVEVAPHGETAVEMFRDALTAGAPFDAAILDITIPGGMGAQETMPKLAALDPGIKGIISSGYSTNPMIVDYRSFGYAAVIVKPYGFKELNEALDNAFK
jgi:DNA-binding response OmpR family regulator